MFEPLSFEKEIVGRIQAPVNVLLQLGLMDHGLAHESIPSGDILVEPLVGLHHSLIISELYERKPAVDELPIGVVFRQVEEVVMRRLH